LSLAAATLARAVPCRSGTALLVASRGDGALAHSCFDRIGDHLRPGDLLVVNDSATIPAALPARLDGYSEPLTLHLSTPTADGRWLVELRTADRFPFRPPPPGARVELPGGARASIIGPFGTSRRLALADIAPAVDIDYLARHGRPIRYRHDGPRERPLSDYQTAFARKPGSAEMPSAARPFTPELVTDLVARGVLFAPITLHTGVSSLEGGEQPYPERYEVPPATARLVNAVHAWGGRVIAVGTTVARALETVAAQDGAVEPRAGYTDLVIAPERGLRATDGLLTGWHEPESSHLQLLEAAADSPSLLTRSYRSARDHGYRWHEFGDSHLILP
jgi:S-adenosylmethionine:tRNA ribosyltransferase-isomerase